MDTILWYEAAGTQAASQVPYICYQDSKLQISFFLLNIPLDDLLFRIVRRVRKNPREQPPHHTIIAHQGDTMFVCMDELIIQQYAPLRVEELSAAMCEKRLTRQLVPRRLFDKVFKIIR